MLLTLRARVCRCNPQPISADDSLLQNGGVDADEHKQNGDDGPEAALVLDADEADTLPLVAAPGFIPLKIQSIPAEIANCSSFFFFRLLGRR